MNELIKKFYFQVGKDENDKEDKEKIWDSWIVYFDHLEYSRFLSWLRFNGAEELDRSNHIEWLRILLRYYDEKPDMSDFTEDMI